MAAIAAAVDANQRLAKITKSGVHEMSRNPGPARIRSWLLNLGSLEADVDPRLLKPLDRIFSRYNSRSLMICSVSNRRKLGMPVLLPSDSGRIAMHDANMPPSRKPAVDRRSLSAPAHEP
jgi:hypothetical protein